MSAFQERLENIKNRIANAEMRSGRTLGSVTLIAVSKTKPSDIVMAALKNGIINFGENYVQEAIKKIDKVKLASGDLKMRWHLIGALQTNKSKSVVGKFETIQSVDRIELAKALSARAIEANVVQNILIQVKLGDEPTKGGVPSQEAPELIENISSLKNIKIEGLMALPPIEAEPEGSRKYFSELAELRFQWSKLVSAEIGNFNQLSMGTTHDFEVAIEEGATMVRVGTALFGSRDHGGI